MRIQSNALVSDICERIVDSYSVELYANAEVWLPIKSFLAIKVGNCLEIVESATKENQVAITECQSESRVDA